MTSISASIGTIAYKTDIHTGTNSLIADEPVKAGGQGLGFSPFELLASSLGACTCITLKMYAERKGWQLTDVKVDINFERNAENNHTHFVRKILLSGNLNEDQRRRLLDIANMCPIHKILTHPIDIETELT